ncbi:MAG: tetratricopeptide repeat protein [Verrucomicrobiota bacterium]
MRYGFSVLLIPLLVGCVDWNVAWGQEEENATPSVSIETEGPIQLLERGRTAFLQNDFATAEEALEKFIVDYGEAEEVEEAVRIHRPYVAISKVALRKFGEALSWIEESLQDPKLDRVLSDELRFWRGICLMTQGDLVDAQRAFGQYWANENHQPFKRYEALLLFATLYLQQDFPAEAADFLADQLPKYRNDAPEAASRAIVLELYARIQAEQYDAALALLRREYPNLGDMTQVISFQTLALQLGSKFLEQKRWYEAITCLQRIWGSEKLMEHQGAKVTMIEDRIAVLEQRGNAAGAIFQLNSILKRVQREQENFAAIENFDSALRLRLASAYQGLGRFREAALIMSEMLEEMEPDDVVESATLAQIQCWVEIGNWDRAVAAADAYIDVFGVEGKSLSMVLFLRAESLREAQRFGAAQIAYGELVEQFPEDEFAPKSLFMQGFLYLQQGDNEGAFYQFDQVQRNYEGSGMVEDADFWTGMAHSFSGAYEEAREHMEGYLDRYETPKYRKEAVFRIAVCTFSLAEYELAIKKLEAFNESYPGDPLTDEANLLLGDAFFADGDSENGLAAYDRVRPESGRFFEDAWFKKGNAFKLLEEFDAMREHFATFVENFSDSPRMPEAIYWIGWTHTQAGDEAKAKEIYWETIDRYGDDPELVTMTDVLSGLAKVYAPDGEQGKEDLLTRLQTTKTRAAVAEELVKATRVGWAKSTLMAQTSPTAERAELMDIAKWVVPKQTRPLISVAVAEALLESGNPLTAKEMFIETRKWHPRAVEKGRIYLGLGDIAASEGDDSKAIEYYDKFEQESFSLVDAGAVKLKKADIYARTGQSARAREALESVLETPGVTAKTKAGALFRIGELLAEEGEHKKAIVYFERVYVVYGKFSELNAKAYWARGQSLEALDLKRQAYETYAELVSRADLSRYDEVDKAEVEVDRLKRFAPASEESGEPESGESL